jgi:hypothetical protein
MTGFARAQAGLAIALVLHVTHEALLKAARAGRSKVASRRASVV